MMSFKKAAAIPAALALAALLGTGVSASAQDAGAGDQGVARSDVRSAHRPLYLRRHADRGMAVARRDEYRPLTVARRPVVAAPLVVAAPPYNPYLGPRAIITGPLAIASTAVSIPFRILGEIFPPVGPTAIIGAPIQAAGQVAQAPFMIAEAPFGGPGPLAY